MTQDLSIEHGTRKRPIGIIGTKYIPLDNVYQIHEALDIFVETLNRIALSFEKALLAVLILSYIQPFIDGNKRTARMIGNAVLLAYGYCPLSYRSVSEVEYKKAVPLFYEQHSIVYFKRLFIEQYEHAIHTYFRS